MGGAPDSATSLTLLDLLCGPERDEAAWRVFYERYEPLIRRWCTCRHLQKADAEDVCHAVLERLFEKISTYDPMKGRFRGWLKTVVENAIRDFLRARGRRPGDQGSGDSDVAERLQAIAQPESTDDLVEELDTGLRRDLDAILARVEKTFEPATWRAYCLVVVEGRPIKEVAAELGKSIGAVGQAVYRVKNKLRAEGARLGERRQGPSEDHP